MESIPYIPKINGKQVDGQAHLQPGINHWIGIFEVAKDLLDDHFEDWKSAIIEYEGPFHCRKECTYGKGKAKIMYVHPEDEKHIRIHVRGTGEPELEKAISENRQHRYNVNLTYW